MYSAYPIMWLELELPGLSLTCGCFERLALGYPPHPKSNSITLEVVRFRCSTFWGSVENFRRKSKRNFELIPSHFLKNIQIKWCKKKKSHKGEKVTLNFVQLIMKLVKSANKSFRTLTCKVN